jgi:methanogenic corrinoid protein MtbC1
MSTSGPSDGSARAPAARMMGEGIDSGTSRRAIRLPAAFLGGDIDANRLEQFVAAIRGPQEAECLKFVQRMLADGTSAETIYLDLLAPAARRMGELWDQDTCDFLDVSMAVGRLQRVLRSLSHAFLDEGTSPDHAGSIILTCLPGHNHTFGLFLVAEFFVRAGWAVSIGAPVSNYDLHTALRADWFDVVAFSVSLREDVGRVASEIRTVRRNSRNPRVKVIVGGRLVADHPELVAQLGADGATTDAREGPVLAHRLSRAEAL